MFLGKNWKRHPDEPLLSLFSIIKNIYVKASKDIVIEMKITKY